MNLAIIISSLSGGGAERIAQIVGNYYVDKGSNVYYFILDKTMKQDYPVKGNIVYADIKSCMSGDYSDWQRMTKLFLGSFKIRRMKIKYQIDTAVSFMEEANYLNVLSKGKEKVITRVCTILSKRKELRGFLYKKDIVKFFYSKSDRVVVMSQYAINDMNHYYQIPLNKIKKIPNTITKLDIAENCNSWNYGTKSIVCVGRLEPVKQHERIIRAFSYVCQREPEVKLIILGKGKQMRYLKHICEKYKMQDKVVFVGFTDRLAYYFSHARAYVMASQVESFGCATIEAMSCGVPVIVTDAPGACGEIVGKNKNVYKVDAMMFCKYGILTPDMPHGKLKMDSRLSKQEIILGEAMLKLLQDDDMYEKYRKQSFKRAEMYRMDKVMKKWDSIIEG